MPSGCFIKTELYTICKQPPRKCWQVYSVGIELLFINLYGAGDILSELIEKKKTLHYASMKRTSQELLVF